MNKRKVVGALLYVLICASVVAPLAAITYHAVPAAMFGWNESRVGRIEFHPATWGEVSVELFHRYPRPPNWHFVGDGRESKPGMCWLATDEFHETIYTDTSSTSYRGFAGSYAHRTFDSCCHDVFVVAVALIAWAVAIAFLGLLLPRGRAAFSRLRRGGQANNIPAANPNKPTASEITSGRSSVMVPEAATPIPQAPIAHEIGPLSIQPHVKESLRFTVNPSAKSNKSVTKAGDKGLEPLRPVLLPADVANATERRAVTIQSQESAFERPIIGRDSPISIGPENFTPENPDGFAASKITQTPSCEVASRPQRSTAGRAEPYARPQSSLDDFVTVETKQRNDQEKVERAIDRAGGAALLSGGITLVLSLIALGGKQLVPGVNGWGVLDAAILVGLAFGVYKRSRICAILLTGFSVSNEAYIMSTGMKPSPIRLIFIYFFFRGMLAMFAHHKQLSPKSTSVSHDNTQRAGLGAPPSEPATFRQEPPARNEPSLHELVAAEAKQKDEHPEAVKRDGSAVASVRRRNYFVRHWRGDLSLGISYWVNWVLGTVLVSLAITFIGRGDGISLKWAAAAFLLVCLAGLIVSVWQGVGVWRSASNHVSRGGKPPWASLAKVIVILGLLQNLVLVYRTYIPQSAEMVSIIAGDTRLPAYHVRVLPGGTEVELRGGLRAGCANELEGILSAVPQANVLHIESPGGRITEAKKIMRLVRDRGLITYTSKYCLSAATLVLMSGKERVVDADAKVGFHAGTLPGATGEQQGEMDSLVRTTMHSAGVSEQFIKRVLETPPNQMWYPTFEEMRGAGVVTSQSMGDRFATSWDTSEAKMNEMVESLGALQGFRVIRELEPEAWKKMMAGFVSAIRSGRSEAEAVAAISQEGASLMPKYLLTASDEALLALVDQWIGLLRKYKDTKSRECIAALTTGKVSFSRAFPDYEGNILPVLDLVMRSGGSTKIPVSVDKKAADEDLKIVVKPVADKYGDDLELLQKADQWMDNSAKVCDMLLIFYQQIALLPPARGANVFRYLQTLDQYAEQETQLPPQPQKLTADSYVNLSFEHFREGRYVESIAASRLALDLRPDYAEAWNNIAAACNKLGRYEEAAKASEQALRYNPDSEFARNNLKYARDMAKALAK